MSLQAVDITEPGRNVIAVYKTNYGNDFTLVSADGVCPLPPLRAFLLNDKKIIIQSRVDGQRQKLLVCNDADVVEDGESTFHPQADYLMSVNQGVNGIYGDNVLYYSYDFSAFYSLSGSRRLAVSDKIPWDDTDHVTMNSSHYFYCIDKQRKITVMDVYGNIVSEVTVATDQTNDQTNGQINDIIASEKYLMVNVDNYKVLLFDYMTGQLLSTYSLTDDSHELVARLTRLVNPMIVIGQAEDYAGDVSGIAEAIKGDKDTDIHFLADNLPKKPQMSIYDDYLVLTYHPDYQVAPVILKISDN